MRPAIRSTFDIVAWIEERGGDAGIDLKGPLLMKLLYLCQAVYASEHNEAKLMPATFLATGAGPIEPDIFLALEQGIGLSDPVAPSDHVEEVLLAVWGTCSSKSAEELDDFLKTDKAFNEAIKRGRNSEIRVSEMATAYTGGVSTFIGKTKATKFPDGSPYKATHSNLDAVPSENQEVRFTADGRSVTRWEPKKRVKSKDVKTVHKAT